MPVYTSDERAAAIAARKELVGRSDRRWMRGEFRDFAIFRVPVEYLVLNADNRRFRAEKLRWQEDLGRLLDPQASEADERSIISILLDDAHRVADGQVVGKASKDAAALMRDWQLRGQEQPLWIRPDGWVINGNRRLAALKRMALEQGTATGTFSYVEALVLDWAEVDDNELFEMEAREQLTEGFKVRYGDLNTLLTLREAAVRNEIVWTDETSIETVAQRIQDLARNNASYAAVQLRAIRYMDEYLDYIEEPGAYQRLIGQVERFRDIAKNMQVVSRETPDQALDFLVLQFQAVQADLGHLGIRELRKLVVEEPDNFGALVTEVQDIVDNATPEDFEADPPSDDDPSDEPEEDEGDGEPPAPRSNFPRRDVKRSLELAIENRQSRKKNDTEAALRGAASRLEQVTPERLAELLEQPKQAVTAALQKVRDWVESVRDVR